MSPVRGLGATNLHHAQAPATLTPILHLNVRIRASEISVVVGVAHEHRGQPDNREVPMFADRVPGRETVGTVAPRVKGRPLSDVV